MSNPLRMLSGHPDNVIRVWTVADASENGESAGKEGKLEREISGHSGAVAALATLPNEPTQVVSGSADGTLRIWNAQDGQQLKQFNHESPVLTVAVLGNGKRVVSTGENRQARCLLYTSPSPRDQRGSRMPSSA